MKRISSRYDTQAALIDIKQMQSRLYEIIIEIHLSFSKSVNINDKIVIEIYPHLITPFSNAIISFTNKYLYTFSFTERKINRMQIRLSSRNRWLSLFFEAHEQKVHNFWKKWGKTGERKTKNHKSLGVLREMKGLRTTEIYTRLLETLRDNEISRNGKTLRSTKKKNRQKSHFVSSFSYKINSSF